MFFFTGLATFFSYWVKEDKYILLMVNQRERSGRYCELTYSLDLCEELREL